MTKEDKQIKKLLDRKSDSSWTFSEVKAMLSRMGFEEDRVAGSHYQFINLAEKRRFTIARHGKDIRPETIKEIRRWYKDNFIK